MKRKSLSLTLCLLTCLALIGVGFAAWVVSAGDTKEVTGNITVDTVEDHRYQINVVGDTNLNSVGTIIFGRPASVDNTGWLANNGGTDKVENLSVSFKVTVSKKSDSTNTALEVNGANQPTLTAGTISMSDTAKWNAVKNASTADGTGLIKDGTVSITKSTDDGDVNVYVVTVSFKWGDAFGTDSTNPYTYYNAITNPSDAVMQNAVDNLKLISDLSSVTFSFTLTLAAPSVD